MTGRPGSECTLATPETHAATHDVQDDQDRNHVDGEQQKERVTDIHDLLIGWVLGHFNGDVVLPVRRMMASRLRSRRLLEHAVVFFSLCNARMVRLTPHQDLHASTDPS